MDTADGIRISIISLTNEVEYNGKNDEMLKERCLSQQIRLVLN